MISREELDRVKNAIRDGAGDLLKDTQIMAKSDKRIGFGMLCYAMVVLGDSMDMDLADMTVALTLAYRSLKKANERDDDQR